MSAMMHRRIGGAALAIGIRVTGSLGAAMSNIDRSSKIVCAYGHNPSHKSFEHLIRWLVNNRFRFISDVELCDVVQKNRNAGDRLVWLSFDDGYRDTLDNVIPIIERYRIPVTLFVCPGAIERGWLWFDVAREYASLLPGGKGRDLYKMPNSERERTMASLLAVNGIKPRRTVMTRYDVISLSQNPLVSIQNHTYNHVLMDNCTEGELLADITLASKRLCEWTGKMPWLLSYPGGRYCAVNASTLRKAHVSMAVTCDPTLVDTAQAIDPYLIPRTALVNDGTLSENLCQVFGVWQPVISRIKRWCIPLTRLRQKCY